MTTQLIIDGVTVYDSATPVSPAPPVASGGLARPTTQEQFRVALQAAFDGGYVLCLDPATNIAVSSTVDITVSDKGGHLRGVIGNGAKLVSSINDGSDVLRFTSSSSARSIIVEKLSIDGGVYDGKNSGNGLSFTCPKGKAIYKATVRDIVVALCGKAGVYIQGDFFESLIDNLNSENNNGDGLSIADVDGIISNVMVRSPNLSRNHGYGLRLDRANSVDVSQGSFILNGAGGILASNGIRTVDSVNFENSGLVGIDVPTSDYVTRIVGCNASSDENTHDPKGVAMKYTLRYGGIAANLKAADNYYTFYGTAAQLGAVRAP